MELSTGLIIGVIVLLIVAGGVFYYYKKRNLEQLFNQLHQESKQLPKKKKNSFLLLMFKESLSTPIKKSKQASHSNKLRNPKYLQVQLVQMSKILKDTSKVEDKTIKRALKLLDSYKEWEKAKIAKSREEVQSKAS